MSGELPSDPGPLLPRLRRAHPPPGRCRGRADRPGALRHPLLPEAARALEACHQVWLAARAAGPGGTSVEEIDRHADACHPDWIGKDPTEIDPVRGGVRVPRL